MSALGLAASGAGQGYVQGTQYQNEQRQQQQKLNQGQQGLDLQRQGQQADIQYRDTESARHELEKMDAYENSPDFTHKLTPGQRQRITDTNAARRSRIYHQFPQLSDSAYQDNPSPYDESAPEQPSAQPQAQPEPSAFANVQPSFAPDGTPQATLPGDVVPTPAAAVQPTAPAPAKPAPVAGPVVPTPAKTLTERLIDKWVARANDPAAAPDDRERADEKVMEIVSQVAQNDQAAAAALLQRAQAAEVHPNAQNTRAQGNESIAASQYDRGTYKPTLLHQGQETIDLQKLQLKAKSGAGMTVGDRIRLMELQNTVNQQALARQDKQAETQYTHGKDAAEFQQRNDLADKREGAAERTATLGVMAKSVMTVDPITHVPVMKPGGVAEFQRLVQGLHTQGKQVTAEDVNPGYPPSVWAKVNEPGMSEQAIRTAVQNALVAGDKATAVLIKNAWAATRMLGGSGTAAPAGRSKPAAKPAMKPAKTQYTYGGSRGEERR